MEIAIINEDSKENDNVKLILAQQYTKEKIHTFQTIQSYHESDMQYDLLIFSMEEHRMHEIEFVRRHYQKQKLVILVISDVKEQFAGFYFNVVGFVLKKSLNELLLEKVKAAEGILASFRTCCFKSDMGEIQIQEEHMLFFYFEEGFVYLKLKDTRKPVALNYRTLKELLFLVSEAFVQVNRNYVVNINEITKLDMKTHKIIISNLHQISVSKRNWRTFLEKYHMIKNMHDQTLQFRQ